MCNAEKSSWTTIIEHCKMQVRQLTDVKELYAGVTDPDWIRILTGQRIRIGNPDPGTWKLSPKKESEESSFFLNLIPFLGTTYSLFGSGYRIRFLCPLTEPTESESTTMETSPVRLHSISITTFNGKTNIGYWQCCGTVTIFYGSSSDFWKVTYGSGCGSDFWKSYGSGSYFRKVPVPIPTPF